MMHQLDLPGLGQRETRLAGLGAPALTLSDSHILVDFLAHIPCELSTVLDGLEIGPA